MLSLYDGASIERALSLPMDPRLHDLLASRIATLSSRCGPASDDLTHFLVVEAGDTEAAIVAEIGFSPLVNIIDGVRFGSPGFHQSWDWLQDLGGWFELIMAVGNGGFAFVLLIQDVAGVEPELLNLCRTYAD